MYKGKQATTIVYCSGELDTCLPCPGEKIKTSPGDSVSLCDVDCGGGSKVANAEHTACGKSPQLRISPHRRNAILGIENQVQEGLFP